MGGLTAVTRALPQRAGSVGVRWGLALKALLPQQPPSSPWPRRGDGGIWMHDKEPLLIQTAGCSARGCGSPAVLQSEAELGLAPHWRVGEVWGKERATLPKESSEVALVL